MTDAPPLNPNPTNDPATSSAPTTVSTAPSLLPPPLKRKYDELAQDLAPGKKVASKRKKTNFTAMGTTDQFLSLGRFFPRAVNPYLDIGDVFFYGPEKHWGSPPASTLPPAEVKRAKVHVAAFDKLFVSAPDLLPVLKELYAHANDQSGRWENLVKAMRTAATSARTMDTNGLKHELALFLPQPHKDVLLPPVMKSESKSDRGLSHRMLRHFVLGSRERLLLPPLIFPRTGTNNPSTPTTAGTPDEDTNPGMSAEDIQTLKNIDAGTYEMTDKDYPSFFYEDGSYDPEDLEKGLLRGEAIPRFLRHIWVGPKSAVNGLKEGIPSGCNARLHNSFKIVPEMIGYAGVQARTALSTKDWRPRDGSFKYDKFFQRIVDLFADVDDPWVVETLAWFQNEVFGDNDAPASEPNDEDNTDDVDPVLAQRAARRAAAAAARTSESV